MNSKEATWNVKEFWEDAERANGYASRSYLFAAEEAVIQRFKSEWAELALLDIGVGAGRTTQHFAPLVKSYVGVDFSSAMIGKCREHFPKFRFEVQDARAMGKMSNEAFDFVAFSYNGLGELRHEDIDLALQEVHRVLKASGHFFFSQHNILGARRLFEFKFRRNPLRLWRSIMQTMALRRLNPGWQELSSKERAVLHDYAADYSKVASYVSPRAQVRQLERFGFHDTRIILNSTAKEVPIDSASLIGESFVHYLTQKR